jgi:catechol 2,3-dioxygenase-like lactoylglutathione lyase family enzyme
VNDPVEDQTCHDRQSHGHVGDVLLNPHSVLSHLSLGVRDLECSQTFYDAVLASLGFVRVWRAKTAIGYGAPGGEDRLALKLRADAQVRLAAGPGFHLAFAAPSRAAVDAFHAAALKSGGQDDGAPGLRPHYGANYYAAFVTDPDAHKLEAVHQ